jgi:hypothetical protein
MEQGGCKGAAIAIWVVVQNTLYTKENTAGFLV